MNVYVFMIGCGIFYGLVEVFVVKMVIWIDLVWCWYDLVDIDVGWIVFDG